MDCSFHSRAALRLLPQGTAVTLTYSSRPLFCRIHSAKGRHCGMENVSNQYIKAADYHFEANTRAVMTAADKARALKPCVATRDSYGMAEDDEMKCLSLCYCCCLISRGKKGWKNILQASDTRCIALPTLQLQQT